MAMAIGMAVTISAFGILTIILKNRGVNIFSKSKKLEYFLENYLDLIGAFIVTFIGLFLFVINF